MKVYLVFLVLPMCHNTLITICSTEEAARDLGDSYCQRLYHDWLVDWETKHNKEEAYRVQTVPDYKIVPVELDQRELDLVLQEIE